MKEAHTQEGHEQEPQQVPHNHGHNHTHTKEVLDRLARASGHLNKVRRMVEDGEDCSEVLIQLAAVKSALNNTGKVILKDHIEHCIVHAVEDGDQQMIEELNHAIDRYMK
ncbi:metal-sensing transcriptional repressor [Hespellia stercorisuis]|uniref:DNA-binding transcriptional regulator, FrmR family n=1 Tax=Hespellia stercorisuis DSM 15480 TaxID=1121950 RepID=A0A1M6MET0_9FIRM|nr:metal-sensing transcriptional repressor [Hespellia stercorisuis]SHJ81975.1 DNA-binding transcriptional regulator, FrmR family [Hespellia stercorisuis DSM 15480]